MAIVSIMVLKIKSTVITGLSATLIMSLAILVASLGGLPRTTPPGLLAQMSSIPIVVAWMLHFGIGIGFTAVYLFLYDSLVKIRNLLLKGVVFGLGAYVIAQTGMALMIALLGGIPKPFGATLDLVAGSLWGHVVFGIILASTSKEQ